METGHVKQVATFEKFVEFCNAHGTLFNPSKTTFQLTALNNLLKSAQQAIEQVKIAQTEYENAINTRKDAFDALPVFMTRIVNALAASEATDSTIADAYGIIHRLRPKKKGKIAKEVTPVAPGRKNSQLDYDSRTSNMESLVKLASQVPTYQPNELELQVHSLQAYVATLQGLNSRVIETQVALSNARIHRNKLLYGPGIHRAARIVKHYIKGVFGFKSAAYRQVSGLRFIKK